MLDVRGDFLALEQDPTLVYLDSAATSLKPRAVVERVAWALGEGAAPVYRGVYARAAAATEAFEAARASVAGWFGVAADQVVFTRGATDGVNLVRRGWKGLRSVVTTDAEHHSNLLPWRDGLEVRTIPLSDDGCLSPGALEAELAARPADLVAVSHVGNVLGAINPVAEISRVAHERGAALLVDAAQSASHLAVALGSLGADYLVCSAHKMLGPTGVGALVATPEALDRLAPVSWGGSMVESVTADGSQLQPAPRRWEAGTPAVEAALGWGAAIEYLEGLGASRVADHFDQVTAAAVERLRDIEGVRVLGPRDPSLRSAIVAMEVDGWESHALARAIGQRDNICIRSGFHCAQPLHQAMGLGPTLRASFHVYTSADDLDRFADALRRVTSVRFG
ncbi:aminotransferase class V-fold PLP-dependent enzyme [Botrimarina sp.]|uniref:aminotransferase class V-fold PLP-dependent enzyme n=1 Tax=Botrimarina sp. TaxID=2795802 RepID=UPI0032EF6353